MSSSSQMSEEARILKRAQLRQDYRAVKELAKAPGWRRGCAGMIDLYVGLSLFISVGGELPVWAPYTFLVLYFIFRDAFVRGTGLGKAVCGLRIYDYETLVTATRKQGLFRGVVYSTVCAVLVGAGLAFSASIVVFLPLSVFGFFFVFGRMDLLSLLGYCAEDGRTIPDDWAGTHVLPPKEVRIIRNYEKKLRELSHNNEQAEQGAPSEGDKVSN